MVERLTIDKPLIQPVYSQAQPNQPIDFGTVTIGCSYEGTTQQAVAQAQLEFLPRPWLAFSIPPRKEPLSFWLRLIAKGPWRSTVSLIERGVGFDAFCLRTGPEGTVLVPEQSVISATPRASNIVTCVFHVFNFPDFRALDNYVIQRPDGSILHCGRACLNADGWKIDIAALDNTAQRCKALSEQGGYGLTHMGRVQRVDGSAFSSEDLDTILHYVHRFLSFALGRWAGVALPIGYDKDGSRVFEKWGLPLVAAGSWKGTSSWFDKHHGELLSQAFPGFVHLSKKPVWAEALPKVLYWYLAANERGTGIGVDAGLVLAQAALELLAWTYCVEERHALSEKAFDRDLDASDKLRVFASSLGLPLPIPVGLKALHGQPCRKWTDAMHAITGIRNAIIHPHSKSRTSDDSELEAWMLSLWYFDLILLRLCGHGGEYANRLARKWVGEVEEVPWAKAGAT